MKRLILVSSLLAVCLTTVASVSLAGDFVAVSQGKTIPTNIKPFNLVYRAYNGDFSNQGIPSFNRFAFAYQNGQIKAEDLIKVAIDQGRLSQETLNDPGYINAVKFQLRNWQMNGNGPNN